MPYRLPDHPQELSAVADLADQISKTTAAGGTWWSDLLDYQTRRNLLTQLMARTNLSEVAAEELISDLVVKARAVSAAHDFMARAARTFTAAEHRLTAAYDRTAKPGTPHLPLRIR